MPVQHTHAQSANILIDVGDLLRRSRTFVAVELAVLKDSFGHFDDQSGLFDLVPAAPHEQLLVRDGEQLLVDLNKALKTRACRVCGCWEAFACEGACGWASANLCTACVGRPEAGAAS